MNTKDVILELRTKKGLSQDELAEKVYVTRQAVSRWETGETVPNTETLKLLSRFFDVSINTLLGAPRQLICQCCGMPLEDGNMSREPDGSFNEDYCKWCYTDGAFTYQSMDALIDFCAAHMANDAFPPVQVRAYLQDLLPKLKEMAGDLRHAIRIDTLSLHLVWGEPDPADAAMHYGQAWGVLEALLAFTEANFTVKKRDLSVALDYQIESPRLTVEAACSISVAQLLSILWPTLKEAIRGLRKRKKTGPSPKTTKQRAAAMAAQGKEETHGKESSCQ